MKIVVIGGSGLIGSNIVKRLSANGHTVVAASPGTGVNTLTGEGLAAALAGAQVVVDVANSPSFADQAVLEFFETSGKNLLAAEAEAGVEHHVALSVVGSDRLADSGYMRAKLAQEKLITASKIPYTILRSTQFFAFITGAVQDGTTRDVVISSAPVQPIAGEDVAATLADIALTPGSNQTIEVAGPERYRLDELATQVLTAYEDPRGVIVDVHAPYFGAELGERSLLPGGRPRIAPTRFSDWLRQSLQAPAPAPAPAGGH